MHSYFFDRVKKGEPCPHPDELLAYFASTCTIEKRMEMDDHFSRCPGCRMALIQLRALFSKPRTAEGGIRLTYDARP